MNRGDLVRHIHKKEFGLVLAVERTTVVVSYGNGLSMEQDKGELEVVPFGPGA